MLIKNEYKPKMLEKTHRKVKPASGNGRIMLVLGAVVFGFCALIGRGVYMHTVAHERLTAEGNKRVVRYVNLPASRGEIVDRNNVTLALSVSTHSLYAIPSEANLSKSEVAKLSDLLDMPSEIITNRLNIKNHMSLLASDLSEAKIQEIKALKLEGLDFRRDKYDEDVYSLFARPNKIESLPQYAELQLLAEILNRDVREKKKLVTVDMLSEGMQKKGDFIFLKRQLEEDVVQQIKDLNIKGLAFQQEYKRNYPLGNMFAHIIGYTNIDGEGQEGLERALEDQLQGQNGQKVVWRDKRGNVVDYPDAESNREAQNGQDVQLSLDRRIQTLAHDALKQTMQHHRAKAGSVVVLDAQTGEVLAMVNAPDYDPNKRGNSDPAHRRNRSVTDMIEPGSTFKPFSVAKALDDGKIRINQVFDTHPYHIGPATVKDTHVYPSLDVKGIIQKSSNVGTSKISAMYKPQEMHDFYSSIGIGKRGGSGFPGESKGKLRPWKTWVPIEQATMSFGYGLQVSLLQLARAYTVLTADGKLMPISFKKQTGMPIGEQIIKPETARMMRKIMVSVTEPGGTGTAGAVAGFDVGAKTGTALKYQKGKGYTDKKYMATFVGFAPAQNPRIIVAVNIDEPSVNGFYGGTVAGPLFKNVMQGSLNILGVQPTHYADSKTTIETAN